MARPPRDIEIIELLPVDDAPQTWPRLGATRPMSTGAWSRRRSALAALGVIGAVALAVVAFGDSDGPADPPATSSTMPGVVAPVLPPLAPEEPAADGLFVLDDPTLRAYSADITSPPDGREAYRLWTSSVARVAVAVELSPAAADAVFFVDAVRRQVGGFDLVSPISDPSTTTVVVDLGEAGSASVWTLGLTDEQIVSVVVGVVVADGASVVNTSEVFVEFEMQLTAKSHSRHELLQGVVHDEARYLDEEGSVVTLSMGEGSVAVASSLLTWFATDVSTTGDGRVAARVSGGGPSIVLWEARGHLLSLTGQHAPSHLLDLSSRVRGAAGDEWRVLVAALQPDFVLGEVALLASRVAGVEPWRAGVQVGRRGGRPQFLWWWTVPGAPGANEVVLAGDLTAGASVTTVVVRGATYVFVSRPQSDGGGTVTVAGGDGQTVELQLQQPFTDQPVLMGAVRVDAPGPIHLTS